MYQFELVHHAVPYIGMVRYWYRPATGMTFGIGTENLAPHPSPESPIQTHQKLASSMMPSSLRADQNLIRRSGRCIHTVVPLTKLVPGTKSSTQGLIASNWPTTTHGSPWRMASLSSYNLRRGGDLLLGKKPLPRWEVYPEA